MRTILLFLLLMSFAIFGCTKGNPNVSSISSISTAIELENEYLKSGKLCLNKEEAKDISIKCNDLRIKKVYFAIGDSVDAIVWQPITDNQGNYLTCATGSVIFQIPSQVEIGSKKLFMRAETDLAQSEVLEYGLQDPSVNQVLILNSLPIVVASGGTVALNASGGLEPYSFVVKSGSGAIDSNGLFQAPGGGVTETNSIEVASSGCSMSANVNIDVVGDFAIALSNLPTNPSKVSQLNVSVSLFGSEAAPLSGFYKYVLKTPSSACTDSDFANVTDVDSNTPISNNLGVDGEFRLCVIGQKQDGSWQTVAEGKAWDWKKDTSAPTVALSSSSSNSFNSTSIVVDIQFSENISGLELSDFQVTNGTISNLSGASPQYSLILSPNSSGTVSLQLKSDAVSDVAGNANLISTLYSWTYDTEGPSSPSIAFSSNFTSVNLVSVNLSAVGATEYYLSTHDSCGGVANWQSYNPSPMLTLDSGDGTKTYFVKYRDSIGNESTCVNASIVLDTTAPTVPTNFSDGSASSGSASPTATWSASSDAVSGVQKYMLAIGTSVGDTSITNGWVDVGNILTFAVSTTSTGSAISLVNGATYYTSIRAIDNAGNISAIVSGDGWVVGGFTISSVSPNFGSDLGGNTITVNGSGFVSGAVVSVGNINCSSTTFVSSTNLTCLTPANQSATNVDVKVTNSGWAGGSVTLANAFTYMPIQRVLGGITDFDSIEAVDVDSSGNYYVAGFIKGDQWDSTSVRDFSGATLNGKGLSPYNNAFVAKVNSSGVQQWVLTLGGNGAASAKALKVDASGNVYVLGSFYNNSSNSNTVKDFSGAILLGKTPTVSQDIFLAKLNLNGSQDWIKVMGGIATDDGTCLDFDGTYLYIGGSISNNNGNSSGVLDFYGNSVLGVFSTSTVDGFVAKINANTNLTSWVQILGGNASDYVKGIAVSSSGNVFVGGTFVNSDTNYNFAKDFSSATLNGRGNSVAGDAYLAKLNSSGMQQWIKILGGTSSDNVTALAVDSSDNVYVTGQYVNNTTNGALAIDFSGAALTGKNLSSSVDLYVASVDTMGSQRWIKKLGGTSSDQSGRIKLDINSNVYVTGSYNTNSANSNSVSDFAGASISGKHTTASDDVFVAKLSSLGAQELIKTFGGSGNEQQGGIAVAADGRVIVGGQFINDNLNSNLVKDFLGGILPGKTTTISQDAFVQVIMP